MNFSIKSNQNLLILGLKLKNTAKEKCGHAYMGGIIWRDSLRLALLLDHFIVNIRQGVDLKLLLDSKKVFDSPLKKDALAISSICLIHQCKHLFVLN